MKALLFCISLLPSLAFSLIFSPNNYTFVPESNNVTARFVVTNNSDEILPIEFYIVDKLLVLNE